MGGLAGLIDFDGGAPDSAAVRAMATSLAARGPDGEGWFTEGPAALAHRLRRVRAGSLVQPCVRGNLVVLLDGWIYDLDAMEGSPDASDTELLAEAWARWGVEALDRLEGEFALAVWDRAALRLTLARDRLGTRPLFWSQRGRSIAFASAIPALFSVPWVGRELNRSRIAEYLSFQVVHAPRTLVEGIDQVEPGCVLQAQATWTKVRRYWQPQYAPVGTRVPEDHEVVEGLREAVAQAVHRRIPPDVSPGLFLSGGLGSTAVAHLMPKMSPPTPCFAVGFEGDRFPETPYAGRVATLLGMTLHEVVVDSPGLAAMFDESVVALGHPVGHAAVLLQLALARRAREEVRVVLSGNGGESLFGGRQVEGLARDLSVAAVVTKLPSALLAPLRPWMQRSSQGRRLTTSPRDYALQLELGGADLFSADERRRLLADPGHIQPDVRRAVLEPWYADLDTDPINTVLHGFLRSALGERALPRADRTAAAAGLDVRFPLLDTKVVQAAAALPGAAKVQRVGQVHRARWPLRAMLADVLPPALLDRPKRSLPVPLGSWLAGPGRLFFERRFQRLREDRWSLWRSTELDALREDVARSNAAGNRMWTLFALDAWLRLVLDP